MEAFLDHLPELIFALLLVSSAIGSAASSAKKAKRGPRSGTRPPWASPPQGKTPDARPPLSELEERVRQNFEKLMGGGSSSASTSARPPAPPAEAAAVAFEPAPAARRRALPREFEVVETPSQSPVRRVPRRSDHRGAPRFHRDDTTEMYDRSEQQADHAWDLDSNSLPRSASKLMGDYDLGRTNLRRAVLLREILGPPRGIDPYSF